MANIAQPKPIRPVTVTIRLHERPGQPPIEAVVEMGILDYFAITGSGEHITANGVLCDVMEPTPMTITPEGTTAELNLRPRPLRLPPTYRPVNAWPHKGIYDAAKLGMTEEEYDRVTAYVEGLR